MTNTDRRHMTDCRLRSLPAIGLIAFFVSAFSVSGPSGQAAAGEIVISRVVDSTTARPGGGTFDDAHAPNVANNGKVVFTTGTGDRLWSNVGGGVSLVVDTATSVPVDIRQPGITPTFTRFGGVFDGTDIVFSGSYTDTGNRGAIFRKSGATLSTIIDEGDSLPDNFRSFDSAGFSVSNDGDLIVASNNSSYKGIYKYSNGTFTTVVNSNTQIPGKSGTFGPIFAGSVYGGSFRGMSIDNGEVAFYADDGTTGEKGIYSTIGGNLGVVANVDTAIPGGSGNFKVIDPGSIYINNSTVAFIGSNTASGTNGVYASSGGQLYAIADKSTRAPDGVSNFVKYNKVSFHDGNLAFQAVSVGTTGIYSDVGGTLRKVIATGDALNGSTVSGLQMSNNALGGRWLGFQAVLANGISGIYVATLPTDVTLAAGANSTSIFTRTAESLAVGDGTSGTLSVEGNSTLTVTGTSTVGTGGQVSVASGSTISATSTTVTGTLDVDGTITGTVTANAGGTIKGNGTTGDLTVNGGTIAPGGSTGTLAAGNTTWGPDGTFEFEINDFNGTAGSETLGWDLLDITGTLTITATQANPFTIDVVSLTAAQAAGLAQNFDDTENYSLTFVQTTGGITGFNTNLFTIDTSGFQNPFTGTWSLSQSGNNLMLNFTAQKVPEPSSMALLIASLSATAGGAWRRRKRGEQASQDVSG